MEEMTVCNLQLRMKDVMIKLTLSRKKPTESLHASRNVSLINDTKTCKHEEINVKGNREFKNIMHLFVTTNLFTNCFFIIKPHNFKT